MVVLNTELREIPDALVELEADLVLSTAEHILEEPPVGFEYVSPKTVLEGALVRIGIEISEANRELADLELSEGRRLLCIARLNNLGFEYNAILEQID